MMNKRVKVVVSFAVLLCSVVLLAFWMGSFGGPSGIKDADQSEDKSMEYLADQYAGTNSTLEDVLQEIDNQTQSAQLSAEDANWLKARITELRNAASPQEQQLPEQPETFEDFTNYFVSFDSQTLSKIEMAQALYDQYSRSLGLNAPITQSMLQVLNQAKLKETGNLMFIDSEINRLILNGTVTSEQGFLLKARVYELRAP